jgi:hypothetical protein
MFRRKQTTGNRRLASGWHGCLSAAAQPPSTPGLRTLQGKRWFRKPHARDRLLNL